MTRVPRSAAIALLSSAAVVAATAGAAIAAPGQGRAQLPGSVPSWANAANRQTATAGSTSVDFKVYLDWQNAGQAADYAMAASTGKDRFLTPQQFRNKFAPTQSQVSDVESWLKSQGFSIGSVPSNNKYVEATGTVAQASTAFQTGFGEYKVDGKTLRSNSQPLSVPSTLPVEAVTGLDESYALMKSDAQPPGGFRNARPCSSYWGEKTVKSDPPLDGTDLPSSPADWAPCGYAGAQLQGVYGMTKAINAHGQNSGGKGVTVAIIDAYASPTAGDDLQKYSSLHGLPPASLTEYAAPGTYKMPNNPAQYPSSWSGEEALDLEAVHTMAPGADLVYVGSPNNYQDMDAALNKVVNNHLADIVTNSYGFSGEAVPPGYRKPFNDIAIQGAAEGISIFFSSGDYGDETMGDPSATPTPDWPASSPWVTAVGGTSLGIDAKNQRVFELGWETGKETLQGGSWSQPKYMYGSGGGTSRFFAQPSYQAGVVPDSIANKHDTGQLMRVVPDVAALGDPTTGMLVGQTQTFPDGTYYDEYRIGGTSLASPLYAGMFALAVQKHGEFGLANPALYSQSVRDAMVDVAPPSSKDPSGAVRPDFVNGVDATDGYVYSARLFDYDSKLTIHVRTGYDDVTGLGVPDGQSWVDALGSYGK